MEILDRLPTDLQEHVKGYVLLPTKACERLKRTAEVAINHFCLDPDYYFDVIVDRELPIHQRLNKWGIQVVPEQRIFIEKLKCRFVNLENFPGFWYKDIYLDSVDS